MSATRDIELDTRLTEIEAKLSYAEDLIEQLNRTIFRQQEQMDLLQQEIRVLYQHAREAAWTEPRNPADEVPPHY